MTTPPVPHPPQAPHPPQQGNAARGFGIASFVVAVLSLLPALLVLLLMVTVDPNYGWFMFWVIPFSAVAAAIAVILGVVGIVLAAGRRSGFLWPILGLVLGAIPLVFVGALFWQ